MVVSYYAKTIVGYWLLKTRLSLFVMLVCISYVHGGQMKTIPISSQPNVPFFANEYWSASDGSPASARFENFFFDTQNRFSYTYGYSGGMYWAQGYRGTYDYDAKEHKIILKVLESGESRGAGYELFGKGLDLNTSQSYEMKLDKVGDKSVLVSYPFGYFASSSQVMSRNVGMTRDQYWYEGPHSSDNSIHFTSFGQAEIVQVLDSRDKYMCEYHLIDDFLFLEIKSVITHHQDVKQKIKTFSPALKTFLRVRVEEDVVYVEHVDLKTLLNNKRKWIFENKAFHVPNAEVKESKTIAFDEYNRRK